MEPSRPLPSEELLEEEEFSNSNVKANSPKAPPGDPAINLAQLGHNERLHDVRILLLMLRKLKVNQKIIFQIPAIIEPHSFFDWTRRKYYQEDSNTNLASLRKLIRDIKQLFDEGLTDSQRKYLLNDLNGALEGIKNLFTTYNHNTLFCSELTLIVQDINDFLTEVAKM